MKSTYYSALALSLSFTSCGQKENKLQKPNVLVIQVDDLGFDDLSLHGNSIIETPNIDQIGKEAVQFDQFYLQNVSAPSRASFLTGRNFQRTGVTSVHAGRDFMNLDETLISEVFQANGYKTAMWGKWHSGKTDGYFPWDRGFDQAYYTCLYNYWDNTGLLNNQEIQTKGYTTDVLTDMAISFLQENKDEPFFAYLSHLAPHNPWRAPQENIDKYLKKGLSKPLATLYGMIDNLDNNIGRLMQEVDRLGLSENTIIVFMSDNGPWSRSYRFGLTAEEWIQRNPSGLKGNKGTNWENGITSPLFIRWENHFEPTNTSYPMKVEDLFPTLTAICGLELPKKIDFDGIDVSSVFEGITPKDRNRSIYFANHSPKGQSSEDTNNSMQPASAPLTPTLKATFSFEEQGLAIRGGDYKFIQNQQGKKKELYNITEDPKEENNLIETNELKAQELEASLKAWYQGILKSDSFNMPVFQIAWEGQKFSQIYTYAPSEISQNLINSNHYLGNWTQEGDWAKYDLKVHEDGKYEVFIVHEIEDFSDFTFSVYTQNDSIANPLKDSHNRNFGTLIEGESAYWDNFDKFETFRKSIVKSKIGELELLKTDKNLTLQVAELKSERTKENSGRVIALQLHKMP